MAKEGKGKGGVGKEGKGRGKGRKRRREIEGAKGDGVLLSGGIDAPGRNCKVIGYGDSEHPQLVPTLDSRYCRRRWRLASRVASSDGDGCRRTRLQPISPS